MYGDQILLMLNIIDLTSGFNPNGLSRARAEQSLESCGICPDALSLERGDALKSFGEMFRANVALVRNLKFRVPDPLRPECRKLAAAVAYGQITEGMLKEPKIEAATTA